MRLRIDDRSTPELTPIYLNDIFETLYWLGIDWDEGPRTPQEHREKYSQHLFTEQYLQLLARLVQTGKVYACTCTRRSINAQSSSSPNECNCRAKNIPLTQPDVTWRIVTPENLVITIPDAISGIRQIDLYKGMRDFSIRRRDGQASYQVVSLYDDLKHETNLVVRGMDLLQSTAAQIYLADLLGEEKFKHAIFYHHPLLPDLHGKKLSKSTGGNSLRSQFKQPKEFYGWLSGYLGWREQAASIQQMLEMVRQGMRLLV